MSIPEKIPFWEQKAGDGPVTRWVKSRDYLDERQKQRLAKLIDPRSMAEQAPHNQPSRRALGLCMTCGIPAEGGKVRCGSCAVEYNERQLALSKARKARAESRKTVAPEAADATSCDFDVENV